eukprot:TRINITY_DN5006_c0_g1_i1.p1 TRINITY_DN5006_c0_g1~~TRINITY_DN5006_c0_g1_i1.p1  ORF type:complete len:731 (-),score=119.17 TRINITY_DN5006_c0_g1_i1:65-2257(-)
MSSSSEEITGVCSISAKIGQNLYIVCVLSVCLIGSALFLLLPFITHLIVRWRRSRDKGFFEITTETLPINVKRERTEVELKQDAMSVNSDGSNKAKSSSPTTLTPFLKFYLIFIFFYYILEGVVSFLLPTYRIGIFFQMFHTCIESGIVYYAYLIPFFTSTSLYVCVLLLALLTSLIKAFGIIVSKIKSTNEDFPQNSVFAAGDFHFFPSPSYFISFTIIFTLYLSLFLASIILQRFKDPQRLATVLKVFRGSSDILLYLFYIILIQFIHMISGGIALLTFQNGTNKETQVGIQKACDCATAVDQFLYAATFVPVCYVTCLLISRRYYSSFASLTGNRSATTYDIENSSSYTDERPDHGYKNGSAPGSPSQHTTSSPHGSNRSLRGSNTPSSPRTTGSTKLKPQKGDREASVGSYTNLSNAEEDEDKTFDDSLCTDVDRIQSTDVKLVRRIGHGGYGTVWKATLSGTCPSTLAVSKKYAEPFAAKTFIENTADLRVFSKEVSNMKDLHHKNILPLMAYVLEANQLYLITPLMRGGNVFDLIHSKSAPHLSGADLKRIALDTAKGVKYLHTLPKKMIHRDLKSMNLLIETKYRRGKPIGNLRIADFGLSRSKEMTAKMSRIGTVQWVAPEVLLGSEYNEKCDVFSYAVILWEIGSGEIPFEGLAGQEVAEKVVYAKARPRMDGDWGAERKKLIYECWHDEPTKRPNFVEIVDRIESMSDDDWRMVKYSKRR